MDWNQVRQGLFTALKSLNIYDIYLVEHDSKVVTVSIIVQNMERIRQLHKIRMIDRLLEMNNPELYRQYTFCYDVWDKPVYISPTASRILKRTL